jgi:hypothetical protein
MTMRRRQTAAPLRWKNVQQAADDPRIGRDWLALNEQIGIDFAGEPLLRHVKCVVHDVYENLICEKTLERISAGLNRDSAAGLDG